MDYENYDISEQNESKRPAHLWKPGESGNPAGRPRKTDLEKQVATELMSGIKALSTTTLEAIQKVLDPSNKCQAMARVRMIEIVLSYILGKPSSEVKLNISADEMAKDSEIRIAALIQAVKGGQDVSGGYDAIIQAAEEADRDEEMNDVEP